VGGPYGERGSAGVSDALEQTRFADEPQPHLRKVVRLGQEVQQVNRRIMRRYQDERSGQGDVLKDLTLSRAGTA
jgi:hypothetical protein